jgi:AcrR family transcriptional regulator
MTRDRDATSLRILDAAFAVLSDDGFAGFGVNSVARAAACDKKLIYRYFDGIDGLWEAMGLSVAEGLVAALAPHLDTKPSTYAAMIERLGLALYEHVRANPRYRQIKLLELSAAPAATARFRAARGKALRDWMVAARGDLQPPAGIDVYAINALLIAAVEGVTLGPASVEDDVRLRSGLVHLIRSAYGVMPP